MGADRIATCRRNGVVMNRIPYGKEDEHESEDACGDCGVAVGQLHARGCDQEQCPACGGQIITCDCTPNAKKPPKPFSPREQAVVQARKSFAWKHVGFTPEGNAIFEVSNASQSRLPFLSIGVRGPRLVGGAWLDVAAVVPGTTARVEHACYKELVPFDEQHFFDTRDPTPETREDFWEFKRLSKRT
jgi:hypothetical protein